MTCELVGCRRPPRTENHWFTTRHHGVKLKIARDVDESLLDGVGHVRIPSGGIVSDTEPKVKADLGPTSDLLVMS